MRVLLVLAVAAAVALATPSQRGAAAPNTFRTLEAGGQYTSLALDAAGFPVISHYDPTAGDLRVVHCGDATCLSGNSFAAPDTANNVGRYSSLALDLAGNPVVSYMAVDTADLRVLHCGNPNCTSGNTVVSLDTSGNSGLYSSLALDGNNPAVAYFQVPLDDLRLIRCNDPACVSSTLTVADPAPIVGEYPSIVLDASGFPAVSYYDASNADLKVIRCGNAACTSGNVIVSPDTFPDVGKHTSLVLDAAGNPVVSYYDETNRNLKVLRCGNPTCTAGNTISEPDTTGDVGRHTSIALDGAGNPVVSYYRADTSALRVLRCGDPSCSIGNSIFAPDTLGDVGQYTSLRLDSAGLPVVSYYDATNGRLKLLRCGDPFCTGSAAQPVGGVTELARLSGDEYVALGLLIVAAALALAFGAIAILRRDAGPA